MIAKGRFREDLYYRLKVLSVQLPPLRARDGDVVLLMQHYISYYAQKFGKGHITLSPEALSRINDYSWPGNIREIRNVSEQLTVLCEDSVITGTEIASVLPVPTSKNAVPSSPIPPKPALPADSSLSDLQARRIAEVLAQTSSRKEAAEVLGISKTTLWRKCKELGLN